MRTQPIDIYQGDDYSARVNVTHEGAAFDLTGYTATAQIRRAPADTDASADASFTCTIAANIVTMTVAHTVTAALTGCYGWDLQLTETSSGLIRTIARGPLHVTPEYTR